MQIRAGNGRTEALPGAGFPSAAGAAKNEQPASSPPPAARLSGFIVLEVKGGYKIECFNGRWTLWETPSSFRKLSKSPYEQARASMHTFAQKYQEKYFEPIPVNYAFAVCFPHYNVDSTLCLEMNSTNTICQSDIQNGKLSVLQCPSKQVVFQPTATIALNLIIQGVINAGAVNIYITPFEHNAVTRVLHPCNPRRLRRFDDSS